MMYISPWFTYTLCNVMFAGSPPATDTGAESSEDAIEAPQDNSMDDEQHQVSELNLEPSTSLDDTITDPSASPKPIESADSTQSESVQDTTLLAKGQSKHQSSPTITSPLDKPTIPSAESAETAIAKGTKDDYIVSIPLSLVRVSRKSKSRSGSKDFGGKFHKIK